MADEDFMEDIEGAGHAGPPAAGSKRGKAKAQGAAAKANAKSAGANTSKICFALLCENKAKNNAKWCFAHNRDAEAMMYQAKVATPPEVEALQQILTCPHKAQLALTDFAASNCDGAFRKKLIDWLAFKRRHGVRVSITQRENETLMGVSEFLAHKRSARDSRTTIEDCDATAMAEWQRMLNDTRSEIIGSGANAQIWVQQLQTRFRDRTRFIENGMEEGSRNIRNPNAQQVGDLLNHITGSAPSFGDEFLRGGLRSGPLGSAATSTGGDPSQTASEATSGAGGGSGGPGGGGSKPVEVALDAPKHKDSLTRKIDEIVEATDKVILATTQQLDLAKESRAPDDRLQIAYERTCVIRLHVMLVWAADTVEAIPPQQEPPSETSEDDPLKGKGKGNDKGAAGGAAGAGEQQQQHPSEAKLEEKGDEAGAAVAAAGGDAPRVEAAEAADVESGEGGAKEKEEPAAAVEETTPRKVPTSNAASSCGDTPKSSSTTAGQKVTRRLQTVWKSAAANAQMVTDTESMMSLAGLREAVENFDNIKSVEELASKVETIGKAFVAARQLRDGTTKASAALKGHLQQKVKAVVRKRNRDQKANEKVVEEQVRKQARVPQLLNLFDGAGWWAGWWVGWLVGGWEIMHKPVRIIQRCSVGKRGGGAG